MKDKIVESVIEKYKSRSEMGAIKYGTYLHQNNADDYLLHLQQELQDGTLYIEKLIYLKKEITALCKMFPNDTELGAAVRQFIL
tara:strand:+ start:394 stop:645 length:252 start_codon:yes stop_codon:yes gene_type:complete